MRSVIYAFRHQRVLVLGDMVADVYVVGRPARISREAPVLILHHSETFVRPGGATNVAANVRSLGAGAAVVGIVGDDQEGRDLRASLESRHVDIRGLLVDPTRPTTTNTRILAKGSQEAQQQIVRIDRIDAGSMNADLRDRMIDVLRDLLKGMTALIISDYEHGVISREVIDACLPAARAAGMTITVDSHGDLFRFQGVTAATPNQPEAEATLATTIRTDKDLTAAGKRLLDGMDAQGVLITRGSEGIALFERGRPPFLQAVTLETGSQLIDPTGAGDTVAAVFTLALAAGSGMQDAACMGNVAGGEVVRRLGAATLTPDELTNAWERAVARW